MQRFSGYVFQAWLGMDDVVNIFEAWSAEFLVSGLRRSGPCASHWACINCKAKGGNCIRSIIIHCCHITYRPNRPNYRPVLLCKMPLKSHASAGPSSDKWRISDFIKLSLPRLRCEEGPVTSSDDQNGQHCKEYLTVGAKPPKNGTLQSNSKYSGNLRQQTPTK